MGSFQKTIDDLRNRLDVEVRKKGEWESHYIAMKSKLETTIKNHSLELSEYKSMFAQKFDVEYVTREFTEEILAKIHQMRADFDARLAAHRLGVQKIDISIESAQINRMLSEALMARDSISKHHTQVKEMELKIQSYEAEISRLHARIHDLEELTQHSHIDVDAIIRETYQQVREEIARTNKRVEECDYLLGMNVKLVTELQTYQALLDVEEARLKIGYVTETPVVHHSVHRDTATKGHSDVDLVIDEVNMEGHYVHLTNKGNDDFSLSGWSIKVVCGSDSKTFTFSSTHHIKAGKSMRIWSSGQKSGVNSHDNIVAHVQWPAGDRIHVELLDPNYVKQAWHESFYEASVETHQSVHIEEIKSMPLIGFKTEKNGSSLIQRTTFGS